MPRTARTGRGAAGAADSLELELSLPLELELPLSLELSLPLVELSLLASAFASSVEPAGDASESLMGDIGRDGERSGDAHIELPSGDILGDTGDVGDINSSWASAST